MSSGHGMYINGKATCNVTMDIVENVVKYASHNKLNPYKKFKIKWKGWHACFWGDMNLQLRWKWNISVACELNGYNHFNNYGLLEPMKRHFYILWFQMIQSLIPSKLHINKWWYTLFTRNIISILYEFNWKSNIRRKLEIGFSRINYCFY